MVSEDIEFTGFGIDVSDAINLIRKGAFEGKDGLVVVEEEGDVGFVRGKTLDQFYLNRVQILRLVNQDVSRTYGRTLLCLELFQRKEKEVVVVKSQPLKPFIFLEELSCLFPFFN